MTAQRISPFAKNRAEELGFDVWKDFVVPLFYSELNLGDVTKAMVVVGGRGCGKTMLLRYLSYHSMFSPNRPQIDGSVLRNIGLYWKVDTNFASQLFSRGVTVETWHSAFDHFVAITLGREILAALSSVSRSAFDGFDDTALRGLSFATLDDFDADMPSGAVELADYLGRLERKFQSWCKNPRNTLDPHFLPCKAFLLALIEHIRIIPCFAETTFLAFVDEYENLRDYQQQIINSHIKHSECPLIFSIAVKKNGIKTRFTTGDECITHIADYNNHDLDDYLLKNDFELFAAEILFLRFSNKGYDDALPIEPNVLRDVSKLHQRSIKVYRDAVIASARTLLPGLTELQMAEEALRDSSLRNQLIGKIEIALKSKHTSLDAQKFVRDSVPQATIVVPALLHRRKSSPELISLELDRLEAGLDNRFTGKTGWIHNNFIGCYLQLFAAYDRPCPFYSGFYTFIQLANGNLRYFFGTLSQVIEEY